MALTDSNELQKRIGNLKRVPCPKVPVESPTPFKEVILKPVAPKVDKGNEKIVDNTLKEESPTVTNGPRKKRTLSVKELARSMESGDHAPGTKPKPVIGAKPVLRPKPSPVKNSEKPQRPPSIIDKPSPVITSVDTRVPDEKPFPPISVLGEPPVKPVKLWSLKKSLGKYIGTTHPPRPTVPARPPVTEPINLPNGAPPIPTRPGAKPKYPEVFKEKPANSVAKIDENRNVNDDNGIYDDTADNGEGIYDDTENNPGVHTVCGQDICDDTADAGQGIYDDTADAGQGIYDDTADDGQGIYDDTADDGQGIYDDTADNEDNLGSDTKTFGDDIYEPITGEITEDLPPALPPQNEKKAKDQAKEEKKRREKEEKEKKKKEKEEKEREEKEKKKREKEKARKMDDMKKQFNVRGNEKIVGTCCSAADIVGNKWDISATIGETFDIIRKDKPNPDNKWLVRNKQGQYGFINIANVESEPGGGEDLYEDVNAVKESMNTFEELFPPPPSKAPPPPPPDRNPSAGDQEIYDDVAEEGEELYEPLDD